MTATTPYRKLQERNQELEGATQEIRERLEEQHLLYELERLTGTSSDVSSFAEEALSRIIKVIE